MQILINNNFQIILTNQRDLLHVVYINWWYNFPIIPESANPEYPISKDFHISAERLRKIVNAPF